MNLTILPDSLAICGRLGRKNGRGFYQYQGAKKGGVDESVYGLIGVKPLAGIDVLMVRNRLAYLMLNEAAMAHAEGVVRSPRDGDIGAVLGIGFPPFRGGPLRAIDAEGPETTVRSFRILRALLVSASPPAKRWCNWRGREAGTTAVDRKFPIITMDL